VPNLIALVARLDPVEEDAWLAALTAVMPNENVVLFRTLSPSRRCDVEIAIVANPDPADVARLPILALVQSLWAGVERLVSELGPSAPPIVRMVDPEMARTMSEAVLAWTYYLQRDMPAYRENQQKALWQELDYRHPGEMTIGLLGLGALGTAAAERLTHAGFNVAGWSRSAKVIEGVETLTGDAGLQALLENSDILVCLVPLTDATRGLLDAGRLAAMKQGAALINFARGAVIVADDLIAVLDSGRLSHAVLDVF
jgi:glyoxylate/hydroxypyruvate reductase A